MWRKMMLTIEELETACNASQSVQLPKHEIEGPELSLRAIFYPYGFPIEVRTNYDQVLEQMRKMWGKFERQHDTEPMRCDVQVVESDSMECPPEPTHRIMLPQIMCVADANNYSVTDLEHCRTNITISRSALRHPLYAQYFLLATAVYCVATRHATPVHAGCVALGDKGMLLCGDAGAGKSTLSYACARAGWSYVSDDASFLQNGGTGRMVTGNCHRVRFRPTAATLFPEIAGYEITPRAAGKPSIELPTASMTHVRTMQTTRVDFIVFLNRRSSDAPQLVPYRKDVARQFMRQTLWGSAESLARQYEAIERLLVGEVFELRYSELDWAVDRLRTLVREGR
jgi:hypothetical protein